MSNLVLYLLCTLTWGCTWIAITYQLGAVPVEVSICYRFALGGAVLLGYCAVRRLPLALPRRAHGLVALQGLLLFALNYLLTYTSETYISSGLAAVGFTSFVFFNILGARLFFGAPLRPRVILGAMVGMTGIGLIFWPELRGFEARPEGLLGLVLILGGALASSLGNMAALRNQRARLPVLQATAWSMLYGAGLIGLAALAQGKPFIIDLTPGYLLSLLYLSLFGSVFAFAAYLTLLGRIGADRAGYIAVLIPVVALLVSTLVESFHWQPASLAGLVLSLAGAVLVIRRRPDTPRTSLATEP